MEACFLSQRSRRPILKLASLVLFLVNSASQLVAQPDVITSYFEDGVIEVVNEVNTVTGGKGNLCFRFTVEYNVSVSINSIGEDDLKVVGASETNMDHEVPVKFITRSHSTETRVGLYEIGPLDASKNGTYSIQIVEGAVTDMSSNPVPAGEIYAFNQEVTDPMPEILKIHPLQVNGEEVTGNIDLENPTVTINGPYGNALVTMFIDFNNETETSSVNNIAFEILGEGEATGTMFELLRKSIDTTPEDHFTVEYIFGRLDSTIDGTYSVRVVEGAIKGIGKVGTPLTLPAGEVLSIQVNVTDPPPAIVTELQEGWNAEYFPIITNPRGQLIVYYNLSVNPEDIDSNDLIVTGISESNLNEILPIGDGFWPVNVFIDDSIWSNGYIKATYTLWGEATPVLNEANNGLWKVEIREGEVVDKMDPANAIPRVEIGIVRTAVIDPFEYAIDGRIYFELEGTTPSLEDDGYTTDPGLPLGTGSVHIESPLDGGMATQRLIVGGGVIYDERSTYLKFEIQNVVSGISGEGYFEVNGDGQSFFWASDTFTVSGSNGNNGTYTLDSTFHDFKTDMTKAFVLETIPSDEPGGIIDKGTFVTTIEIDGNAIPMSFTADEIPTFKELYQRINEKLDGAGLIYRSGDFRIAIESCSFGPESKVKIIEQEEEIGLFRHLTGSVPFNEAQGNLDWGFWSWGDYFPEDGWDEARDNGRFQFKLNQPGIYRILVRFADVRTWDEETQQIIWVPTPPPPEYAIQALGDPSRQDDPKDHTMYVEVKRTMNGQSQIVNFSYVEETDPPHVKSDRFQVLIGSSGSRLDVLRNDGEPEGHNDDLTIIGLGNWYDKGTLLQVDPPPPTEIIGGSEGLGNKIWTDGDYVYYDSPGFIHEIFYYIVEDNDGRRDFTDVVTVPVSEITNQFFANDDFATVPITVERARINVLANDAVEGGGSKDILSITDITPTTAAGGTVSYQGTDVFYQPPPDFLGADSFEYTMTDGFSGTATATVSITVTNSPVPEGQRALLNLLLFLFGGSQGGSVVFEFWNKHISEVDYLILDQGEGSVAAKASGSLPLSSRHNGGTAETQATWNTILDMAEAGIAATLAGQGDTMVVTQEFVDLLMAGIEDVQARASPDLKADLQEICDMTNDFQDLVGKTFGEGFTILGLPPESISIPNLALERINDVLSITTWDVAGLALKLWKSNDLQPNSWVEVQNAEIVKEDARATISDPDVGDEDVFYRVTSEVE